LECLVENIVPVVEKVLSLLGHSCRLKKKTQKNAEHCRSYHASDDGRQRRQAEPPAFAAMGYLNGDTGGAEFAQQGGEMPRVDDLAVVRSLAADRFEPGAVEKSGAPTKDWSRRVMAAAPCSPTLNWPASFERITVPSTFVFRVVCNKAGQGWAHLS
jgi:hypothetical protein